MDVKELFDREFYERYRQKGGIYVIPVEIFQVLLIDQEKLLEENKELKKQLEEHKNIYIKKVNNFLAENVEPDPEDLYMAELEQRAMDCELMEMQQKEFINYLEDEIKTLEKDILETVDDVDIYMKQVKSLIIEEILQKYKSMIGVSDENNKQ